MTTPALTLVNLSQHLKQLTEIVDKIVVQSQEEEDIDITPLETMIAIFEQELAHIHDPLALKEHLEEFQQTLAKMTHLLQDKQTHLHQQLIGRNQQAQGITAYTANQFLSAAKGT